MPIAKPARIPAAIGGRVRNVKSIQIGVVWLTANDGRVVKVGYWVDENDGVETLFDTVGSL